ncbi:MAG TPA: hypothetical protein VKA32_00655, partial [Gammaproteobacteria bacterium]|nr:hypothetical protein [Gammaproteobacteria bacterium]
MARVRFGVSARLLLGIALLAGLTVAASVTAVLSLSKFREDYRETAEALFPQARLAARLQEQSEGTLADVGAMVLSEAKYRQKAIYQRIKNRLANLKTLEAKLVGTGLDEQRLKDLRDAFDKLDHTLADLDYALARRIALRSHISWNLRQLR